MEVAATAIPTALTVVVSAVTDMGTVPPTATTMVLVTTLATTPTEEQLQDLSLAQSFGAVSGFGASDGGAASDRELLL